MPPVQHVTFDELPGSCVEEVISQEIGARHRQRHDILQLIPEAKCPSGLVVARSRPEAAAQRLVQQPTIHHYVERIVRRLDPDGVQRVVPTATDLGQTRISRREVTEHSG
jgi:hypothetical protein